MRSVLACAAVVCFAAASVASAQERDGRFPFHPPGWDNPKNWSGDNIKVARIQAENRNALSISWEEDSEITFRLESPLAFEGVTNMGLSMEISAAGKGIAWEVVARKPDDVAGQRIGVLEQQTYHYPGYHLLNARKSFRQITFKPSRPAGRLILFRFAFNQREDHLLLRYRRNPAELLRAGDGPEPETDGLTALLKAEGVGTIKDASDWGLRRGEIANAWQSALGKAPAEKPDLQMEVVESAEFGDYHRRKLRVTAEGEDKFECWLLVPASYREGTRFPAVVCLPRESWAKADEALGIADDGGLAHAVHLVKENYVAVTFNCFAFRGDADPAVALKTRRPDWTGLGKMVYDVGRAIDLLESLSFVDGKRVGVIGHGLGGKQALAAAAFEPRVACAVVSEAGVGLNQGNWFAPVLLGEDRRSRRGEIEGHQLLALAAPKPVLVIGGEAADGAKSAPYVQHAGRVYRLFNAADNLALYNHKLGGGFPIVARSEAYQWLEKHLKK